MVSIEWSQFDSLSHTCAPQGGRRVGAGVWAQKLGGEPPPSGGLPGPPPTVTPGWEFALGDRRGALGRFAGPGLLQFCRYYMNNTFSNAI